jgi:hypothetical protein
MSDAGYEGCEFELVIRGNRRLKDGEFMETYNFGPAGIKSTFWGLHKKFDIEPHKKSPHYKTDFYGALEVKIVEDSEMRKNGTDGLQNMKGTGMW